MSILNKIKEFLNFKTPYYYDVETIENIIRNKLNDEDYEILDKSLNLLKSTVCDVSLAASQTAIILNKKLEDSENRFIELINSIDDIVQIKDKNGRWLLANNAAEKLFGFTNKNDYLNKTDQELCKLYPEKSYLFNQCYQTDIDAWLMKKSTRTQLKLNFNDNLVYYDVIKTPIFEQDGSKKELLIIGRDVTELIQTNERNRACFIAMNSASDLITILDKDGNIYFANDNFCDYFSISHENSVGKWFGDFFKEFDLNLFNYVKSNKIWEGLFENMFKVIIIPMKNGLDNPIFYIVTMKKINNSMLE